MNPPKEPYTVDSFMMTKFAEPKKAFKSSADMTDADRRQIADRVKGAMEQAVRLSAGERA